MNVLLLLGRTQESYRFFGEVADQVEHFDARVDPISLETVGAPDMIISYSYRHIVPEDVLMLPPLGAYNLHPSFLPWGRGAHPVYWAVRDGEPVGATIHRMTAGLDRGPIIAQGRIEPQEDDTLRTLYARCHDELMRLWALVWPLLQREALPGRPQIGAGSYHRADELPVLAAGWDTPVRSIREHMAVPIHDGLG